MSEYKLPELPGAALQLIDHFSPASKNAEYFTADQMRDYALAAIRQQADEYDIACNVLGRLIAGLRADHPDVPECDSDNAERDVLCGLSEYIRSLKDKQAGQAEPVAWQWLDSAVLRKRLPLKGVRADWRPLYTAPPRVRVTREVIEVAFKRVAGCRDITAGDRSLVSEVLAALRSLGLNVEVGP